jgi:O-antigen/teichoic acid export membrane protein
MIMLWFIGAFQGFGRIKYLFLTESSHALFRVPLAAVFIFTGFYATGALLGTAAGMLLACIVGLILLFKIMPKGGGDEREVPGLSREVLSFSAAVLIGSLAGMIMLSYGTLFVGFVMGMENTGLYSVPLAIAMLLLYVPGMVTTPLFPVISELWTVGDKERLASVLRASTKLIFSIFAPLMIAMIVFPEFILTLFFGKEFIAGAPVLRILAVSMAFWCVKAMNDATLGGIGKPGLNAKIYWIAAVFAVGTITPLVLFYGIVGAAVALLMVLVLLACLGTFFVTKSTGSNYFSKASLKPWIAAGVMLAAIMALRFLATGLVQAIFIGIIGLSIYFVTFLAIGGIEKGEVNVLKRFSSDMGRPSLLERIIKFLDARASKKY